MRRIKLFEEFVVNESVPDNVVKIQPGDKGYAMVKGKYRRRLWMHDIDTSGNIKLKKPYGMKSEMRNLKTFDLLFEKEECP